MSGAALLAAVAAVCACLGSWEWGSRVARWTSRLPVRAPLERLSRTPDLRERVAAPGPAAGLGSRGWIFLKSGCAVMAGLVALTLGTTAPGRVSVLLMVAAPVAGFLAPDRWLSLLERRRLDAAVRELPDMLDLFRVTVEAGTPTARALGLVASEFDGPLAGEWGRAAAEIALGKSEEDALMALTRRLPADEIGSFVEALGRSRRRGVPIGRAAAAQATAARHNRRRRARERAARAGPKIQLVVALLLVPSVLLLVAAALVVELERSPLRGFPA